MLHNVHVSQYIPCTAMSYVTGTWANSAGYVAGTISKRKTANAETTVVTVPIFVPSNSIALQGAKLMSIELDYELETDVAVAFTAAVNKITRSADVTAPAVTSVTCSQDLAAGVAAIAHDQHKMIVTITTPAWVDHDEYYLAQFTIECGAAVVVEILAAVANFTVRL